MHTNTNTKEELTRTPEERIAEFGALIHEGIGAWMRAGKLLVELLDGGEVRREEILRGCPGMGAAVLERFELIGRRVLHPGTLLSSAPAMATVRRLPWAEQDRLLREKITIVRGYGEGSETKVKVEELSSIEVGVVFGEGGRVRSVSEQREAWRKRRGSGRGVKGVKKEGWRQGATRQGWEPDAPAVKAGARRSLDELAVMTPLELLRESLTEAHAALLESRRHLGKIKPEAGLDDEITHALRAVGVLRFAVNNNSIR